MGKLALSKEQIDRIVNLRQRGYSLPEIKKSTGHGKATIFKYIQGVGILPEFQEIWRNKRKSSVFRMLKEQEKAKKEVSSIIKKISKKERILIAACLYWAEGAKRDFSLSNTDPILIKVFVSCLRELGVQSERLKITIRTYEDLDVEKCRKFWAGVTGIPKSNIINVNVLNGKKKGKLEYGICRVRVVKGAYLLKLLNAIKDKISNDIVCPHSSTDRTRDS